MSLDKAIEHGKEHRKPYIGGKAIAKSCRNHGFCEVCKGNRLFQYTKEQLKMKQREGESNDSTGSH